MTTREAQVRVSPQQALQALEQVRARGHGLTLRVTLETLGQVQRQERTEVTLGHAEASALLEHLRSLQGVRAPVSVPPDPALVAELAKLVERGQELLRRLT